jgi:DNA polymerase III subunit delta'
MSDLIYPWLQPIWQHLQDYLRQDRVPQALLIGGLRNGQPELLQRYVRRLLCSDAAPHQPDACGLCASCHLSAAATHPDFLLVEPDEPGKAIGIDKIRQLVAKLALKPHSAAYRVALLQPADDMNTASSNAFLKYLEEPTERTCLILLCEHPAKLPATVRSRCQQIVAPLPQRELALRWLQQQGVQQAEAALDLAQGLPLLAKRYADQNLLELRQQCLQAWLALAHGKEHPVRVADQWLKLDIPAEELFNWMIYWLCELIQRGQGIFKPSAALAAIERNLDSKALYNLYDELLVARARLSTTLNKQLMLEQLLIAWTQLHAE